MEVTPLLTFATATNTTDINPKTSSGNFYSKAIFPAANFNTDDNSYNKTLLNYVLISKDTKFSSSFKNFYATLNIDTIKNGTTGESVKVNTTSSFLMIVTYVGSITTDFPQSSQSIMQIASKSIIIL